MSVSSHIQPWGRWSTLGLGIVALLAGQLTALATMTWWFDTNIAHLPDFSGDGGAVAAIIVVSTPVQVLLLAVFAWVKGASAADYLGLTLPRRSDVIFGIGCVVVLLAAGDTLSWLLGRDVVTQFQTDIYRTAAAAGWLPLLWFAVLVLTPLGEETLFRGFLFRGWLKSPRDVWPVIGATALLWALIHVQYDWYVIGQVFASGLLLGWLRWVSGSTLLTIILHGLINFEAMAEAVMAFRG